MDNKISDHVLDKIKDEKILPTPKWEFVVKDYLIWFVAVVSVLVGGLAVSIIIFLIRSNFVLAKQELPVGNSSSFLYLVPYFWLIILAIFLLLAYLNFKYTKKGYKINPYLLLVLSVLISLVLGTINYASGFGEKIEEAFYTKVPIYKNIMQHGVPPCMMPQEGILCGSVIYTTEQGLDLQDFNDKKWRVMVPEQSFHLLTVIPIGARIIIAGQEVEESIFEASAIMPMLDSRKMKNLFSNQSERNFIKLRIN